MNEISWNYNEIDSIESEKEKGKKMVKSDGWNLSFLSNKLKDDKDVVLLAVKNVGAVLGLASARLKDDEDVVIAAITSSAKHYPSLVRDISRRLRNDEEIIKMALRQNVDTLKWFPSKFKDNEGVILEALKTDDRAIEYASKRIKEQVNTLKAQRVKKVSNGSAEIVSVLKNVEALELVIAKNFAKKESEILKRSIYDRKLVQVRSEKSALLCSVEPQAQEEEGVEKNGNTEKGQMKRKVLGL